MLVGAIMPDNETTVRELKAVVNGFIDEHEWWQYHTAKDLPWVSR